MYYQYIFIFFAYSLLAFFSCKNMSLGMIKKIGINSRYYPQKFIVPPFKIRKMFKIKQKTIPKYLLYELILAIFFLILGLISIILLLLFKTPRITGVLMLFQSCLIVINVFYFSIMSFRYSKWR